MKIVILFFYSFVYFFLTAEVLVYFIVVSTPNLLFFLPLR